MVTSRFPSLLEPTDSTFNSFKVSRPLSCAILLEKSVRSVILVQFSRPSIFSIRLKERSSHFRLTSEPSPFILVMMLLSSCSLVSFSIPFRLSISTMSKRSQLPRALTFVWEAEMTQVPDTHVLLVENFVFLIVCDHIVLNETIINYCRLDWLSILLNLALSL